MFYFIGSVNQGQDKSHQYALLHCEIGDEDGDDNSRNYPFDDEVNRAGDFLYNLRLFESPTDEDRRHNGKTGDEREYQVKHGCVESGGDQIVFLLHVGSIGQDGAYSQREGEEGLAYG